MARQQPGSLILALIHGQIVRDFVLSKKQARALLAVLAGDQTQGHAVHKEQTLQILWIDQKLRVAVGQIQLDLDAETGQWIAQGLGYQKSPNFKQTLTQLAQVNRTPPQAPSPLPDWIQAGTEILVGNSPVAVVHVLPDSLILQRGKNCHILADLRNQIQKGQIQPVPVKTPTGPQLQGIDPRFQRFTEGLSDRVVHVHRVPEQQACLVPIPADLPQILREALQFQEIHQLYSHQAQALTLIRAKENLILTTPTASGKTLSFLPGVIERILTTNQTVLCLYPLKALQLDQHLEQENLIAQFPEAERFKTGNISRDVQGQERHRTLNDPNLRILNLNPDILHWLLLTHQGRGLGQFLSRLGLIVLDEAHSYSGSFGANLAALLRRLHLAVQSCGGNSTPQYVLCSATVGNPVQLAERLTGQHFTSIEQSGARRAERTFITLKSVPYLIAEAAQIGLTWLRQGLTGIIFVNTRRLGQAITSQILRELAQHKSQTPVEFFKAGILPQERERIQRALKSGKLRLIVSTSSLEAGINIPALDACLLAGYPGSVMSLYQRAGRCGRAGAGLVVFLPNQGDPLDEYFARSPQRLFAKPPEAVYFNYGFPTILGGHVLCAAVESRLRITEVAEHFGPQAVPVLENLLHSGALILHSSGQLLCSQEPHKEIALRGNTGESYRILTETGELLEELSAFHAHRETHPGAIYRLLKRGQEVYYRVDHLDHELREVRVVPTAPTHLVTQPIMAFDLTLEQRLGQRVWSITSGEGIRFRLYFGTISQGVTGYQGEAQGKKFRQIFEEPLPPLTFLAPLLVFDLNEVLQDHLERRWGATGLYRALHGVEHLLAAVISLHILAARQDVDGITYANHRDLRRAGFFLFDTTQGGTGVSEAIFDDPRLFLTSALALATECDCASGCPCCSLHPRCIDFNQNLDKALGIQLLQWILDQSWQEQYRGR